MQIVPVYRSSLVLVYALGSAEILLLPSDSLLTPLSDGVRGYGGDRRLIRSPVEALTLIGGRRRIEGTYRINDMR